MADRNNFQRRLVCLILMAGTALLFSPALRFDFVNYDDQQYILANPHVNHGLTWSGLAWCWQTGYAGNWHPLTWISHMLDCQLFGLHAGGHHATSILIHALNAGLLFLVLHRMTNAMWRSAMVAALFAWHPLRVESVAWIAERKDVLCSFFFLLSLWAYVKFQIPKSKFQISHALNPQLSTLNYFLSLFFFACALMSKPMAVTLPFVLLLLDFWPMGRAGLKQLIMEKIPFFVLSAAASVVTMMTQSHEQAIISLPLAARLFNAVISYVRYLKKIFWPTDLSPFYPFNYQLPVWMAFAAALFLGGVTILAIERRKIAPWWLTGWFWFLGILFPVIGLVKAGSQLTADRFTYLSSVGIFIIVCWEAAEALKASRYSRAILGTASAAVLAACVVLTSRQLQYWRDTGALFGHIVEGPENYFAHANYAAYLMQHQQLEKAQAECQEALRIVPRYGLFHGLLGRILMLEQKPVEASKEFRLAEQLQPGLVDIYLSFGQILLEQKQPEEAADQFKAALKYAPNDAGAHFWMGRAVMELGDLDEACAQFEAATKLNPRSAGAHWQWAQALSRQKKTAEAETQRQLGIKLQSEANHGP